MTVARVDRLIINKREWRERKKSAYAECKKKKKKKKGKSKFLAEKATPILPTCGYAILENDEPLKR